MLYFGHSLIDAGGNSVVQISAIDDIGKIPGFLTLKGGVSIRNSPVLRKPPLRSKSRAKQGEVSWGSHLDHIQMTSFGGFGARRRREKNRVFEQFPPWKPFKNAIFSRLRRARFSPILRHTTPPDPDLSLADLVKTRGGLLERGGLLSIYPLICLIWYFAGRLET